MSVWRKFEQYFSERANVCNDQSVQSVSINTITNTYCESERDKYTKTKQKALFIIHVHTTEVAATTSTLLVTSKNNNNK
ncbi:hypothetical protein DOY81_014555 [Sarcophaga bullata]|nr:hypothetical protein DOY81_014555 [Sarcophaga bullata]